MLRESIHPEARGSEVNRCVCVCRVGYRGSLKDPIQSQGNADAMFHPPCWANTNLP